MKNKTFPEKEIERLKYLLKKVKNNDFSFLPMDYKTYPRDDLIKRLEDELAYFTLETKRQSKDLGNQKQV